MSSSQTRPLRRVSKRIKRWLMAIALAVVPRLYLAYMWLVWKTSTVEQLGCDPNSVRDHYGRVVIALWHEEVFFVAWAFKHLHGHTLASHGDFGEVITRMLELCNFVVFRGGSSMGKSRRSPEVLADMIHHMNTTERVMYGITVDGSRGPAYRMKPGAARIAVACRAPLMVQRTWCRRYLRLRSWDRTLIPLPFNHIVHGFAGPYLPPRESDGRGAFRIFYDGAQETLLDVGYHVRTLVEGAGASDLLRNYPEGWKPTKEPTLVQPFGEILPESPGSMPHAEAAER